MGVMRAGEERCRKVVFKEHLSGEEGLSYRGWWGLETPRIALPWSDDGVGAYSCGLEREVWEVETLFTAIALAL